MARSSPVDVYPLTHPMCSVLFQGKQAKMAAGRVRLDRPIEIFPEMLSNSAEIQQFKEKTSRLANAHPDLQENVDDFGRCYGSGVRSNWNGIRHINGYPMKNGTWPLVSNAKKRTDAGLSNVWKEEWHRTGFRAFVVAFFSNLEPVPLKLRKGSSSVIPFFTKDAAIRSDLAERSLREAEAAGKLMLAGNFKDAFLTHQFGGAYYVVYRSQSTDKIEYIKSGRGPGHWKPKARMVAPKEYAISGGAEGSLFESSKLLDDVDFPVMDGMFRERLRTAMGGPFQLNVALMPIMQSVRKRLYSEFAYSFHHTTRENKQSKVRDSALAVAVDVSDHDTLWPSDLYLKEIEEVLLIMGFADWWVALLMASFKLPIYVGAPAEGEGHTLLGDWRNPNLSVGMPSGQSGTDVFGTLGMIFIYFLMQVEQTAPHYIPRLKTMDSAVDLVTRYMKGNLEFSAIAKTDDAYLLWKAGTAVRAAIALRAKLKADEQVSPYMLISYEHGGAFLGDILLHNAQGDLSTAVFTGNILSMANNLISPEYGVQSRAPDRTKVRRGYPGLAYMSHKDVYGSCPGYQALLEVMEKAWRESVGGSFEKFRADWYEKDLALLSRALASVERNKGLSHLSSRDREVLVSPDKLQYKYDPSIISPEVVSLTMYQIGLDKVEPYFRSVIPH